MNDIINHSNMWFRCVIINVENTEKSGFFEQKGQKNNNKCRMHFNASLLNKSIK